MVLGLEAAWAYHIADTGSAEAGAGAGAVVGAGEAPCHNLVQVVASLLEQGPRSGQ